MNENSGNHTAPPRTIFLDTEVFVQQAFQFQRGLLAAVGQQVKADRVRLVTTELTLDEIRSKLREAVDEARSAHRVFQSKARVLRNSTSPPIARLFRGVSRKKVLQDLYRQLTDFVEDLDITVVPLDMATPSIVFSRYFKSEPPFGTGKKKSEFPDAFAFEALRQFAMENRCRIAVVSADTDWLAAVAAHDEYFEPVERLDQLLQTLQEGTPLLAAANEAMKHLRSPVEAQAREECRSLSFFVADRTATVTDVRVDAVHLRDIYVISVSDDSIEFSVDGWVSFTVDVDYPRELGPAPLPWDLGGYRRRRFDGAEDPNELWGSDSCWFLGTAAWSAPDPSSAVLSQLSVVRPRAVPVYLADHYSES